MLFFQESVLKEFSNIVMFISVPHTHVRGITPSASSRRRDGDGFDAPVRTLRQSSTIKELIVYYVVWLGSMKGMGLRISAKCVDPFPFCGQHGYRAHVPQHRKTHVSFTISNPPIPYK